jgi:hypothetical protein
VPELEPSAAVQHARKGYSEDDRRVPGPPDEVHLFTMPRLADRGGESRIVTKVNRPGPRLWLNQ